MTLQQAIKKAIKEGYTSYLMSDGKGGLKPIGECLSDILLDPSFWQCFSKVMGYEKEYMQMWLYCWHCFIDHLAEGKSIEDFFSTL